MGSTLFETHHLTDLGDPRYRIVAPIEVEVWECQDDAETYWNAEAVDLYVDGDGSTQAEAMRTLQEALIRGYEDMKWNAEHVRGPMREDAREDLRHWHRYVADNTP